MRNPDVANATPDYARNNRQEAKTDGNKPEVGKNEAGKNDENAGTRGAMQKSSGRDTSTQDDVSDLKARMQDGMGQLTKVVDKVTALAKERPFLTLGAGAIVGIALSRLIFRRR